MGDLRDTFNVASAFKDLFGIVDKKIYSICSPLIKQRKEAEDKQARWLKPAIVYTAESSTERFLQDAKIKDMETREALLNSVVTRYHSL